MGKPTYKLVSLVLLLGLVSCGRSQPVPSPEDSVGQTPETTEVAPAESEPSQAAGSESGSSGSADESESGSTASEPASSSEAPRPSPVALAKQDCGQLATQLDMNQCAAENYSISDKALNQVYQEVIQDLDAGAKAQLTTAEERWIVFRDAECKFEADRFAGGSIVPLIQASCMERITDNRIAELRQAVRPESSYAEADAQLNEVYQAVQALATDAQGEALTDVQLTWLDYRDAHCEFEANRSSTTDVQACLTAVTETRVWQLQALQDDWSL
ncbi:MAG: lysozyme inhibitor LprI family protein [Cyanobacteria bacterium P01_A01_bin.137]